MTSEQPHDAKQERGCLGTGLLLLVLLIILVEMAIIAVPLIYGARYADRIFPGVHALSVDLGGLTLDEARAVVSEAIAEREGQTLTLVYGERRWTVSAAEVGLRYDLEATVQRAFAAGRGEGLVGDALRRFNLAMKGTTVEAVVSTDRVRALDYLYRLARDIDIPMQNASLKIENLQVVTTQARTGYRLDIESSATRIVQALSSGNIGVVTLDVIEQPPLVPNDGITEAVTLAQQVIAAPITITFSGLDWVLRGGVVSSRAVERVWTIERAQLANAVVFDQRKSGEQVMVTARFDGAKFSALFATIARELNRSPQNARFDRDTRTGRLTPIRVSQDGRNVDVTENIKRLTATAGSANRIMPLAVTITEPAVGVNQADTMGIRELVGQGITTFAGSSAARTHNIRLAASKIHGEVVPPGGTFSLLAALGPITAEAGYQPGFAIVGDFTVQDIGGGVCQVATTVFRAAFWAGLPIIERNPHRYYIERYFRKGGPPGLDAAVYDPGRDLRFKNTTNSFLLLQTDASDADNFTVSLYGTKPGWTVEIEEYKETKGKDAPPRLPDVEDPTLPVGTRILAQPSVAGLSVSFVRVVRQGSTIISRDKFITNYQPAAEQWVVGTKR